MKVFTYDDYLRLRSYFWHTMPSMVNEDADSYTVISSNKELEEIEINDVHDKSYRDLLNDKVEFSLLLKKFLDYCISPDNLEKYNNAFITKNFENRRSDIVYKVKGQPIYIFVEHQSSIDNSMHFRLFMYYYFILNDTVDKSKLKNKNYKMPIIVPILLYTGNKPWNFIPNLKAKQADCDEFFEPYKININCEFISIHDYTIDQLIHSDSAIGYIMATDKSTSKEELYTIFENLAKLNISSSQREIIQRFLNFVFDKSFKDDVRDDLIKKFNEIGVDSDMKCAWHYLIEDLRRDRIEGRAEGRAEGKAEGKAEGLIAGERKGKIEIIRNMLKSGESMEKISLYTGFSKKKIKAIQDEMSATAM